MKNIKSLVFIEGTLIPISWNKEELARGLGIYTRSGEDIMLNLKRGPAFYKHLVGKRVKARGVLSEVDGEFILSVSTLRPLKDIKIPFLADDYDEFSVSDKVAVVA